MDRQETKGTHREETRKGEIELTFIEIKLCFFSACYSKLIIQTTKAHCVIIVLYSIMMIYNLQL